MIRSEDTKHSEGGITMGRSKIDIEKALQCAGFYCQENGLSQEKLKDGTILSYDDETLEVLRFPELAPADLYDEIKGRGFPILIVRSDYTVEETEYTRQYLTKEGNI